MLLDQDFALVDVDSLLPHPENPRRGDVAAIAESIEVNGFYGAVIAQRSTRRILVGEHRVTAARLEGATVVPVLWVDVDDDHARRIVLVDDRTSDLAETDTAALAEILAILATTDGGARGSGYDEQTVADILAAAATPPAETDVDDVPDTPAHAVSREGDVWHLGPHRLVCGSATNLADVRAALDNRPAAMVFTDPPYGVDYTGGTGLKIANDDLTAEQLRADLLEPAFRVIREVLLPGGAFYVCSPSGALETTFRLALDAARLPMRQQLVWVKNRFVLGRADYHGQHESMLYGWRLDGEPPHPAHFADEHHTVLYGWAAGAAHHWDGGRAQSTVWEYDRPARSAEHPTMKPVDLVQRAILNNTHAGALVLDPFGGSGSTLIACHHAGRVAALVELDPVYVDVICRRWEEHTGIVPVRDGEATSFLELAA